MSDRTATEHHDALDGLQARIVELEAELRDLRIELWQSRDATIGATATAGSYRSRNIELEMIIGQLRGEVVRLDAAVVRSREHTFSKRLRRALADPRIVARRLLR